MKKDCIIRPYQSGDEEDIVRLLKLVFTEWPRFDLDCTSLEHWRWKFIDSPLGYNIYVAECDSRIIGTEGRIMMNIKIGDSTILGEQRVDLAVHPDFRGQGIFTKMFNNLKRSSYDLGIKISYAEESNPIVIKHMDKIGATAPVNRIIKFFWIKDFDLFMNYQKVNRFQTDKVIEKIKDTSLKRKIENKDWDIIRIDKFDNKINGFWSKISNHYDYILKRDKNFLNWRYCDYRGGSFVVLVAMESGEILGYVVLRVNRWIEEYPKGLIFDLLTLPGRIDVAESLIQESLNFFEKAEINEINYWMVENHPYIKSLQKYGLVDLGRSIYFNYIPYNLDKIVFNNIIKQNKKIYLSMGDCD